MTTPALQLALSAFAISLNGGVNFWLDTFSTPISASLGGKQFENSAFKYSETEGGVRHLANRALPSFGLLTLLAAI